MCRRSERALHESLEQSGWDRKGGIPIRTDLKIKEEENHAKPQSRKET
jgi:hypothetical protein